MGQGGTAGGTALGQGGTMETMESMEKLKKAKKEMKKHANNTCNGFSPLL